jgi:stringent starvation protein B
MSQLKKDTLEKFLESNLVSIHLDARRTGVDVPPPLKEDSHLVLNLSYKFPAMALDISDIGFSATFNFKGVSTFCQIPWEAVYGISVGPRLQAFMASVPWDTEEYRGMVQTWLHRDSLESQELDREEKAVTKFKPQLIRGGRDN